MRESLNLREILLIHAYVYVSRSGIHEELFESFNLGGIWTPEEGESPNAPVVKPPKGDITNIEIQNVINMWTQVVTSYVGHQEVGHLNMDNMSIVWEFLRINTHQAHWG